MSDRLAVMHDGRVMQVGTPSEVYSQPAELVRRDASSAPRTSASGEVA